MKIAGVLVTFVVATSLFAGGDNRVSMTDIKEALYNLVISSGKTDREIESAKERISKLEPLGQVVDRNNKNLSMLIERLNTLGVQIDPKSNQDISIEISRFVEQNTQLLPSSARGVR